MKIWSYWLVAGFVALAGGGLSLAHPLIASMAIEQILGFTFIVSSVSGLLGLMASKAEKPLWLFFMPLLTLGMGILFILYPIQGVLTLSVMVTALLMGSGIAQVMLALQHRGDSVFGIMLLSGLISILLSISVLSGFPSTTESILGIIFAVELLSNGFSLVFYALALRKQMQH